LRFSRLLGTGHGRTFTPTDADLRHWALLTCWESAGHAEAFEAGPVVRGWDDHSFERWRLRLRPLSSAGRWGGQEPFGATDPAASAAGACAVITRARLVPWQLIAFWKAAPTVGATLPAVGLQATISLWDCLDAAKDFAYGTAAHRQVIQSSAQQGWYSEQLFARFAVIEGSGRVDGRDPLAVGSDADAHLS
jgi:hypothetical protein